MRAVITTTLDAPVKRIWAELQTTRLLNYVASPIIVFDFIDPETVPTHWGDGDYLVSMRFLGFIPIGRQRIITTTPQPEDHPLGKFRLRDNATGEIAKVWDHHIVIEARTDGRTTYTDDIQISAGALTLGVWFFAQLFYRYRQARLRRLARQGFLYPDSYA